MVWMREICGFGFSNFEFRAACLVVVAPVQEFGG